MAKASLVSREANIARVRVELDGSEVSQHFQRMYRENAKELRIPGFRKGKIPVNIIRQRLGAEAIAQHMDGLLKDVALEAACQQLELTPRRGKLDWHTAAAPVEGDTASYEVSFAVLPEVTLPDFSQWELKIPRLQVNDEMVQRYKQRLQQRFTDLPPKAGPSAQGDALEIDFTSSYPDGAESPFAYQGMAYQLGEEGNLPGWDEQLTGRSSGDKLEFEFSMPANFADARVAGKDLKVELRVNSVMTVVVPELDEEFVKERLRLNSLEDFESMIRANLERESQLQHEQYKRDEALGRCAAELQAEITPDMVEAELDVMLDENDRMMRSNGSSLPKYLEQKGQELADYRAGLHQAAEQRLRMYLAVNTISTQQQFNVSNEDMRRYALRLMQSEGISPEQMGQLMQSRAFLQDASFEIMREKSVAWIVQQVTFSDDEEAAAAEG